MRMLSILFFVPMLLFYSSYAVAQPNSDEALSAKAETLIQPMVKADQFSGVVLVARDGLSIFRRAYGLADREWNVPNTIESKFRIGSMTKQFTATAILQLQEAGKLTVDDHISKFYNDAPSSWNDITIRNLLTHTSGIPDYDWPNQQDYFRDARADRSPDQLIKGIQGKPLTFPPGSKFLYDNMGYDILGFIIEKASGEKWADYLQHHIFDPLGMTSSGYGADEAIIPKRSSGYRFVNGKYLNAPFISMTQAFAAGALYSNVDDMLLWDKALYSANLLTQRSLEAMFADYGHGYGYGWFVDNEFGHQHLSHGGIIAGFASRYDRYPKDHLAVFVLSNTQNAPVGQIADKLAVIYLRIPPRNAAAGGEALIRRTIEALRQATPNYNEMGPQMAEATRTHVPQLQKAIGDSGTVKTVTLLEAGPTGIDRYTVAFQNSVAEWDVRSEQDGKLVVYPARFPAP